MAIYVSVATATANMVVLTKNIVTWNVEVLISVQVILKEQKMENSGRIAVDDGPTRFTLVRYQPLSTRETIFQFYFYSSQLDICTGLGHPV